MIDDLFWPNAKTSKLEAKQTTTCLMSTAYKHCPLTFRSPIQTMLYQRLIFRLSKYRSKFTICAVNIRKYITKRVQPFSCDGGIVYSLQYTCSVFRIR